MVPSWPVMAIPCCSASWLALVWNSSGVSAIWIMSSSGVLGAFAWCVRYSAVLNIVPEWMGQDRVRSETVGGMAAVDRAGLTPAMRQYFDAKEQHPDCLMYCRIGDFYELFYEDAILVARELQLTLTSRDREKKQPMCGVPYHAAEVYLQRLLRKGYRIAMCEQMEDPKTA